MVAVIAAGLVLLAVATAAYFALYLSRKGETVRGLAADIPSIQPDSQPHGPEYIPGGTLSINTEKIMRIFLEEWCLPSEAYQGRSSLDQQ